MEWLRAEVFRVEGKEVRCAVTTIENIQIKNITKVRYEHYEKK